MDKFKKKCVQRPFTNTSPESKIRPSLKDSTSDLLVDLKAVHKPSRNLPTFVLVDQQFLDTSQINHCAHLGQLKREKRKGFKS